MTACILKIIAVITMVIDHTGVIFFDGQEVWRMIGRTAMPLYAFMLVEGVRYTRRKEGGLRRYLLLLVLLAVISEPCYDFAFEGVPVDPEEQNQILQFATFVFAYWLCQAIRGWLGGGRLPAGPEQLDHSAAERWSLPPEAGAPRRILCAVLQIGVWVITVVVNSYFEIGYWGTGIVFLLMLYQYAVIRAERPPEWRWITMAAILFAFMMLWYIEEAFYARGLAALVWTVPWLLFNTAVGKFVFLALPFLALYNGEYGNPPKWAKTAYRIFYPAHLLVLGILAAVLIR